MVGKMLNVTPWSLWLFGLCAEGGQPCSLSTTWEDLAEPCCREAPLPLRLVLIMLLFLVRIPLLALLRKAVQHRRQLTRPCETLMTLAPAADKTLLCPACPPIRLHCPQRLA